MCSSLSLRRRVTIKASLNSVCLPFHSTRYCADSIEAELMAAGKQEFAESTDKSSLFEVNGLGRTTLEKPCFSWYI